MLFLALKVRMVKCTPEPPPLHTIWKTLIIDNWRWPKCTSDIEKPSTVSFPTWLVKTDPGLQDQLREINFESYVAHDNIHPYSYFLQSSIWDFRSKISYMRMIYGLLWKIKGNDKKLGEYIFMINLRVWFNVSEDVFDSKSYWTIFSKKVYGFQK